MKRQTTGVYLIKDDKILFLVRQKKDDTKHVQGMYLPIGGHVELGETLETCAIREVEEESGIKINTLDLKGIVYITGQGKGEWDWVNFVFVSTDFEGDAVAGNEGHFEWVPIDQLETANLYPGDKIYLQYMLKYKLFVAEFIYKDYDLIEYKLIKGVE
jgi:8-oxo-dGTP diphosphatase